MEQDELQQNWKRFLSIVKEKVSEKDFKWFEPLKPTKLDKGELVIKAPSASFQQQIEDIFFKKVFAPSIRSVFGKSISTIKWCIVVDSKNDKTILQLSAPSGNRFETNLNPNYLFDNFVHGKPNELAYMASLKVAKAPGKTPFNPLFIYGGCGLGKTHLLNAIGNYVKNTSTRKKVKYITANTFQTQFQEAVVNNEIPKFLNPYYDLDVLIVDDIQYLAGKRGTQDNFFHIFDALQQAGKQLVFASDKVPSELKGIEERILSRFNCGLHAGIQSPNYELRRKILEEKIESSGIEVNDEVVDFIATNVHNSIRDLEGILASLLAHATISNNEINLTLAKQIVSRIVQIQPQQITDTDIINATCNYYHIEWHAIQSKMRDKEVTRARQVITYLFKKHTEHSLQEIGGLLGNRSHTTILYSIREIKKDIQTDIALKKEIQKIEEQFASRNFLKNPMG